MKKTIFLLIALLAATGLFAQGKYFDTTTFSFTVADDATFGADTDPTYALNHPYISIMYVVYDSVDGDSANLDFLVEFSDDATTFFVFDTLTVLGAQDSIHYAVEYGPAEHPMTKYMRVRGQGKGDTRALGLGVHATARVTGWHRADNINPYLDSQSGR